ncbi:MAG TPA: sulfite exporter TauE/SafE family protein [Thermoplasmata archaeon]|nr:sulfite exporter TauE/SafE family protein [Thermoplasmata archaeon]
MDPISSLGLGLLAFVAALINGAVGYGFSSIVTPIAILWYSNKVLNPALVIVEVAVNVTLLYRERRYIRRTWSRARPLVTTLLPGVILGTIGLAYLAVNDVKVIVYATLLPLVLLQLVGFYRPLKNEKRGGLAVGPGIGFLYALTTISGPPLALFLRNQGMSKNEFRCTIAQIRVAESSLTLGTYFAFSTLFGSKLITLPSLSLLPILVIPVVVGIPLGTLLLRKVSPEFFRRFVMSVDAILVAYGLSRVVVALKWVSNELAYLALAVAFAVIGVLTWLSLRTLQTAPAEATDDEPPEPPTSWGAGEPAGPS